MDIKYQGNSWVTGNNPYITLGRGLAWGLVGGFIGTMFMDFVLMGTLLAVGLPASTCFSIVGNTVARFFSMLGITISGGVVLGVVTHYLIGPLVGAFFGAAVVQVEALRIHSLKKGIGFAVIYVEILAQPILASTPILLKMTVAETVQWFGGSFVMHFIFGVVLGVVLNCGLRLSVAVNRRSFRTKPGLIYSPEPGKI